HTRSYGDWSSDVCSSDLGRRPGPLHDVRPYAHRLPPRPHGLCLPGLQPAARALRGRERGDPAPAPERQLARLATAGAGDAGNVGPGASGQSPARPAVRRGAAARGRGESAGSQARGGLGRRADRQPRHRGNARDRRAAGAHEQGRPDRRPGHPQPAGGRARPANPAHARRSHRIDQWGTRGSGPVNLTLVVVGVFLVTYAALLVIALRRPLLARLALREALRRPGQSAIVVLGLMVGTVAIFAMQVLGDSFYESQTRGAFLAWGRVDLVAADGGHFFDPGVATALAADPRVSASLAGVQAGVELPSSVVDLDRGNGNA